MKKIWRIFSWVAWIVGVILILLNIFIGVSYPRLFGLVSGVILLNKAIDEWINYKNTKRKVHLMIPITAIIGVIVMFFIWQNNGLTTTEVNYINAKVPDNFNGYKIVHISDLHNKKFARDQEYLLEKIRKVSPDMIVVTGDLIDRRKYDLYSAMKFIDGAVEIAPVYYVSGNHEAWSGEYENIKGELIDAGVEIMDDRKIEIIKGNSSIELLGLSDPDFLTYDYIDGTNSSKLQENLKNLSDDNVFQILLSHRPELFDIYEKENIDLIFSGHAHGGQFRIPLVGGLVAPDQGFFPKYTSGEYTQNQATLIVSRGLGNSIIPIRIFNRPEIIVVTLQNEKYEDEN